MDLSQDWDTMERCLRIICEVFILPPDPLANPSLAFEALTDNIRHGLPFLLGHSPCNADFAVAALGPNPNPNPESGTQLGLGLGSGLGLNPNPESGTQGLWAASAVCGGSAARSSYARVPRGDLVDLVVRV